MERAKVHPGTVWLASAWKGIDPHHYLHHTRVAEKGAGDEGQPIGLYSHPHFVSFRE